MNGNRINTKIEAKSARTPNNLLGIARRIAKANKKYHSGTMCAGVTIGSASI